MQRPIPTSAGGSPSGGANRPPGHAPDVGAGETEWRTEPAQAGRKGRGMEANPGHEALGDRLRGQFAPAYLTLTSIIQAAAVTALAARVELASAEFDAADWLLAAATFLAFILIWHEYLMQALAYVWLPTLV